MARWAYLEIGFDPGTGNVTHVDGREVIDPKVAPPARQVRNQLGNEGWELVSVHVSTWLFKREIVVPQQWEYCCLAEDHAGGIRRGEWILVYYQADGNHLEHEHRRLGMALAQLGKAGWQMIGVADPGTDGGFDNTAFYFARPLPAPLASSSDFSNHKQEEKEQL
ncbi:MAG: hypothetical protein E6I59_19070 [Chloroflexi bacterium]|nr:MAG: hypothetical protein E6J31_16690 [Chloroflexota bacterium]TMC93910.1 MAG: hypothetical protein E6J22_06985 [Chloroflexota bacterium]TMD49942.1 MAG: hypothetical protein E6I90_00835 [Chloroflexota bacterium]TME56011.1 MAG: hypothetical protein E6I59_19070 [Chloroflexota bacterium]